MRFAFCFLAFFICTLLIAQSGTKYYVHPHNGDDEHAGTDPRYPWQTLDRVNGHDFHPGDAILLAAGQKHSGSLRLKDQRGTEFLPIRISSYGNTVRPENDRALISIDEGKHGIELIDCSNIHLTGLSIKGGQIPLADSASMRCGILIVTRSPGHYENLSIADVRIEDIFAESLDFNRGTEEVRTSNGTQRYGWGIRVINQTQGAQLRSISIRDCTVKNVGHTGIKFTGGVGPFVRGRAYGIADIEVSGNQVLYTGGPGIQFSRVAYANIRHNYVNRSGSTDDSRKWGRGSGLWTWGSAQVMIESNYFLNANGPGDSAGCHIDFNCNDVVVQYNFSANNAGGFCEILGQNYNCAYRYNISVNDGYRVKGENGAFQDGKTFWLSGYAGRKEKRAGPYNSYFYNNTIYCRANIASKIAVDHNASGILVANNIFYVDGPGQMVMGDQYKPDDGKARAENDNDVLFSNNLYLRKDYWPSEVWIQDDSPLLGDPNFARPGGIQIEDYIPRNKELINGTGIYIHKLPHDSIGLKVGLHPAFDIMGNRIIGRPDLGAIDVK